MIYANCLKLLRPLVLGGALVITATSSATVTDIKPGTPFTPLQPDREQAVTTQQIMNNLLRGHYESRRLDDQLSSRIYDLYLEDLDSTRSYLLAADIKGFEQYRLQFDDALMRGDSTFAFKMYNLLQQRMSERLSFILKELKTNAAAYQFTSNERLELDREKAPWAQTSEELDELWRKRLKNALLSLLMSGKDRTAALELLEKRYQNQLNRLYQSKSEDAYQTVMNSVTRAFDPHTQYFSPRNSENFNINMSLSLQGIGAVLQSEDEYTKVQRLVPAGPAEKARNLKPGDKIVGVGQNPDGEITDVIGWRLDEVVDLIRGPKGTTVRLEVQPADGNNGETRIVPIIRDEVKLEEQSAQKSIITVNDNGTPKRIGVIDIPTFYIDFQGRMENRPDYKSTTRDVERLIRELRTEGIDGLVIDLRNNGGGSLEEAISLTGLFIPEGPVVQVRSARGSIDVLQDEDPTVWYDGPMAVLVNRLSASASEIFAGAIQDYGRGIVIGGQTFGKGTVQSLRPLRNGQLKITQAKFYRVSGESTQHQGVIPDILFPSLFDKDKIGESALEEALPWDTIRPAQFRSSTQVRDVVGQLREEHQSRVKNDPDFVYLRAQKVLIEELRKQTSISLNEKDREQERKDNESRRLALENERRKAKGMPLLDKIEDEDNLEETDPESRKENKEDDALLVESGHILLDMTRAVGSRQASR